MENYKYIQTPKSPLGDLGVIKQNQMVEKLNFNETIAYAPGAVVSKQIIKKETGTVTVL